MEKVSNGYYYMTRFINVPIVGIRREHKEIRKSVFAQFHFNIWKEIGVKWKNESWYEHVPKLVERIVKLR